MFMSDLQLTKLYELSYEIHLFYIVLVVLIDIPPLFVLA
jgi:hypothetical protein